MDNSSPGHKGRGLLVGPSPQPDHPAQASGHHSLQGHILPCSECEAKGQPISLAVPGDKVEGRKDLSGMSDPAPDGQNREAGQPRGQQPVSMVWPGQGGGPGWWERSCEKAVEEKNQRPWWPSDARVSGSKPARDMDEARVSPRCLGAEWRYPSAGDKGSDSTDL